jgi:hypothetical protein
MNHNAPGQLLGYAVQFPRGLYHLLQCGEEDSVCIEVLGDVAVIKSDGKVVVEEDKSSISANPLTDKSTDLWKTFFNWIKAIKSGQLKLDQTRFVLYCNQKGKKSLADAFHKANNTENAKQAINKARTKLSKIDKSHEIWEYYNYCINEHPLVFAEVISNFELEIVLEGSGFEEVRKELKKKIVPESQIEFFLENISGWLQKEVMQKIAAKQLAFLTGAEFYKQFLMLFERTRKRELIDFTLESPPSESDVKNVLKLRPTYIRQLDKINTSDEDVIEAVGDYLKAKANRDKWIELEIIDQDIASDFEEKLTRFWVNTKRRIELTEKKLTKEEKGQLLYIDCKSRQETIRDMSPPTATIAGTYHALADSPTIGWHSDWETEFKSK